MYQLLKRAGAVSSLLLLSACGGGSTSDAPEDQPLNVDIRFISHEVSFTTLDKIAYQFQVLVNIRPSNNDGYDLVLDDPDHIFAAKELSFHSKFTNTLQLITDPGLSPGIHRGTLTLKACNASCSKVYGHGDLTYSITVEPLKNLTPLTHLAGVTDWQTEQGNNAHDDFVPITLDPSKFNLRWLLSTIDMHAFPSEGLTTDAPVTDAANQVLVVRTTAGLAAFRENDGSEIWHFTPPAGTYSGPPAIHGGVVYAVANGPSGASLQAFDEASGMLLFDQPTLACGVNIVCTHPAPVIVGNTVFIMQGNHAESFDATTGTPGWVGPAKVGYGGPAADNLDLYYYIPNDTHPGTDGPPGFTALDQATGTLLWQIDRPADPSDVYSTTFYGYTPVLDGNGGAVVNLFGATFAADGGPIERYDLTTHQRLWQVGAPVRPTSASIPILFNGNPHAIAVGNGMVYAGTNDGGLAALDLSTGAVRWKWASPFSIHGSVSSLIATKNLLFVGINSGEVFALDIKSHRIVWTLPLEGIGLSLSPSGILYVTTLVYTANSPFGEALAAVNLH